MMPLKWINLINQSKRQQKKWQKSHCEEWSLRQQHCFGFRRGEKSQLMFLDFGTQLLWQVCVLHFQLCIAMCFYFYAYLVYRSGGSSFLAVGYEILETSLAFDWWQSNMASCILFMTSRCVKQQTGFECGGTVWSRTPQDRGFRPKSGLPIGWSVSQPPCLPQTEEEEWRTTFPL